MAKYTEKEKELRRAAVRKYHEKFDRICVMLPAGTKDRILSTGASCNAFIKEAVLEKLYKASGTDNSEAEQATD